MGQRDSDQQGFQSFHFRVWSLVLELEKCGDGVHPSEHLFQETRARTQKKVRMAPSPPLDDIEAGLRRGWSHLLSLHRDAHASDFYAEVNAWTPAKAWYAIHHAFTALLPFIASSAKNLTHDLTTTESAKIVAQMKVLPHPFSAWVTGAPPDVKYYGLGSDPQPLSNLADPRTTPFDDQMGLLLRSTADYRIELKRKKWLRGNPSRKRLSPGMRTQWATAMNETTIFHFMYRLRLRVNYDDPDTFVVGAPDDDKAQWFARNLLLVTDALMAGVEGVLAGYVGSSEIARMADSYARKRGCDRSDPVGRRAQFIR
ncbi:MAG: hypothetical protein WDA71_04785 [Actinomycetota bacterium]